ncbi:MAG: hypothetical protein NZ473_04170 [Candidatus Kapabacteria bacterium]|nr:hypothetical protein [Candidatus Kapabacteria bacterium]MDW8224876.1 hypothetical protein [Bacteroidota bacterium]
MRDGLLSGGLLLASVLSGCSGGLDPTVLPTEAIIRGTVRFQGTWPPVDSLRDLRVVAFQHYPPRNVFNEVISGRAIFSERLPFRVELVQYQLVVAQPPVVFRYIVVAQQYGPDLFQHWRVVGVYARNATQPDSLWVEPGGIYPSVDITVDFDYLPPQPFE